MLAAKHLLYCSNCTFGILWRNMLYTTISNGRNISRLVLALTQTASLKHMCPQPSRTLHSFWMVRSWRVCVVQPQNRGNVYMDSLRSLKPLDILKRLNQLNTCNIMQPNTCNMFKGSLCIPCCCVMLCQCLAESTYSGFHIEIQTGTWRVMKLDSVMSLVHTCHTHKTSHTTHSLTHITTALATSSEMLRMALSTKVLHSHPFRTWLPVACRLPLMHLSFVPLLSAGKHNIIQEYPKPMMVSTVRSI